MNAQDNKADNEAQKSEGAAQARVDHPHRQAARGQRVRAGRADDAGANDEHVGRAHKRMPQPKGSSASINSVASALMCARPRSVGATLPPCSGW